MQNNLLKYRFAFASMIHMLVQRVHNKTIYKYWLYCKNNNEFNFENMYI